MNIENFQFAMFAATLTLHRISNIHTFSAEDDWERTSVPVSVVFFRFRKPSPLMLMHSTTFVILLFLLFFEQNVQMVDEILFWRIIEKDAKIRKRSI